MKQVALLLIAAAISSGCATVTKGTTQAVQVEVANCSERMDCEASNKKGTWTFTAPGPVTIKKSDDSLIIRCDDGDRVLTRQIAPNRNPMIWGNVLVGGVIGAGADAITDAHWDLPETVTLMRQFCRGTAVEGKPE